MKPVVLIVEDDRAVAQVVRAGLERDYTVVTAHDVVIARLLLEEHAGDVVLLDWCLGRQCGAELLDALPKREGLARPLAIVCLGGTSGEEAIKPAANAILPKPFTRKVLHNTIQETP